MASLVLVGPVRAATPVKSAKECNEELQRNEAALKAAGESAAAFIHACWWSSEPGKPTPIESGKTIKTPADAPARPIAAQPIVARPAATRAVTREARPARRYRTRSFAAERDGTISRVDRVPAADVEMRPPQQSVVVDPTPRARLGEVDVALPGGVTVPVPVLPGFEPTVRSVLDNPILPGVVTARP